MGFKFNPITGQLDLVGSSGGGGGGPTVKYILAFNNTTDWGAASGGYYTITVTPGTHGLGANIQAMVFELSGSDFVAVTVDQLKITPAGDVSIRVPDSPDLRFEGKLILI